MIAFRQTNSTLHSIEIFVNMFIVSWVDFFTIWKQAKHLSMVPVRDDNLNLYPVQNGSDNPEW